MFNQMYKFEVLIWICLFACTIINGVIFGLIYLQIKFYKDFMQYWINSDEIELICIYSKYILAWITIYLGLGVQTIRSHNHSIAIIYLLGSILNFVGETGLLIYLLISYDNYFSLPIIHDGLRRLIFKYNETGYAKRFIDFIHVKFKCCGYDEWHREWISNRPYELVNSIYDWWVPSSCCIPNKYGPTKDTCGYAPLAVAKSNFESGNNLKHALILSETVFMPSNWFSKLFANSCPESIHEWLGEWPCYFLMMGFGLSISKLILTTYAVLTFGQINKKKSNKQLFSNS